MARSRILKPEFWSDEKLAKVPREARLTFAGLWTCSDDYGVTKGHPAWLKAQIFPYDIDLTLAEFQKWLADLEMVGVIIPFTADGESFFYIRNFSDHQRVDRPSKMRNPPCPPDILAKHSRAYRESLVPDSEKSSDETETETERETENTTATDRGHVPDARAGTVTGSPKEAVAVPGTNVSPEAEDCPPLQEDIGQEDKTDLPADAGRHQPKPMERVSSPAQRKIEFDYETGHFRHVLSELVEKWQQAYPAVDVLSELRRMETWATANPVHRKSNWQRFIVNWLAMSQDRARKGASDTGPPDGEGSLDRWLKKHSTTS
jgi:hypothetical protein